MMKRGYGLLAAIGLLLLLNSGLSAQSQESRTQAGPVGRYQLVRASENQLYLIDTATGQCWSRLGTGPWTDEGNPTRGKKEMARNQPKKQDKPIEREKPSLELPGDSVELIILQREERAIPGSDGSVRVQLGDITEGQAFLSVVTEEEFLVERKSVTQGDSIEFKVGEHSYSVHVEELHNILIGDDFAKIIITPVLKTSPNPRTGEPQSPKKKLDSQRSEE